MTDKKIIKIVIAEDSAVQRDLLCSILSDEPQIEIIQTVENGLDAIPFTQKHDIDLLLMDLHMPKMNGIDSIKHIMSNHPLPIIAMSASSSRDDVVNGFKALEAGALAFADKPIDRHDTFFQEKCDYLINMIKAMAEVKVIKRRPNLQYSASESPQQILDTVTKTEHPSIDLIVIGVSTGGPLVLETILSKIPKNAPPIAIVQHISTGFIQGMADWLSQSAHLPIHIANHGQLMERGHVYFAPDNYHMGVTQSGHIELRSHHSLKGLCPSVGHLFLSAAKNVNKNVLAILLTGMGNDGAKELKVLRDSGAITVAQSEESCLIYGMPGQAVSLRAATYVLNPEEIAGLIALMS